MTSAKPKAPYTFPHKSRKAKVAYLGAIGGYSSRHNRWPLEFTVSTCMADLDFDTLAAKETGITPPGAPGTREHGLFQYALKKTYDDDKDSLYMWAVEDACRSVPGKHSDSDAYRMLYDGDRTLDVECSLEGRGGKHLVIDKFEGLTLRGMTPEELEEKLLAQTSPHGDDIVACGECRLRKGYEWEVSNELLDTLYRYVRQCEIDFTTENASAEVEYQAAYYLQSRALDVYSDLFGPKEETGAKLKDDLLVLLDRAGTSDKATINAVRHIAAALHLDIADVVLDDANCVE